MLIVPSGADVPREWDALVAALAGGDAEQIAAAEAAAQGEIYLASSGWPRWTVHASCGRSSDTEVYLRREEGEWSWGITGDLDDLRPEEEYGRASGLDGAWDAASALAAARGDW